jgi:hypothetical protein
MNLDTVPVGCRKKLKGRFLKELQDQSHLSEGVFRLCRNKNHFIKTIIKILQLKILKIISAQTESTE